MRKFSITFKIFIINMEKFSKTAFPIIFKSNWSRVLTYFPKFCLTFFETHYFIKPALSFLFSRKFKLKAFCILVEAKDAPFSFFSPPPAAIKIYEITSKNYKEKCFDFLFYVKFLSETEAILRF